MKLAQAFNPRQNALNALRLGLALSVIVWHSFPLSGHHLPSAAFQQFLGSVGVDGFFAISGFLITASWLRHPQLRDYSLARGLRILPGFYACLILTAFVIAPVGVAMQGGSASKLLLSSGPIQYVVRNAAVTMAQFDVGGTPHGLPAPGWNGSLWTLGYELYCYIGVACFGVVGLLGRRWLLPFLAMLAWLLLLVSTVLAASSGGREPARLALMFLAGALIHHWRHVIPARWSLVAISVIIAIAASWLPDYRLVAAFPLAYAVIVSGSLIYDERFQLTTDLSYGVYIYAFPIQQLLIIAGAGTLNPLVFAVIATILTLPMAALSWILIEKPAMTLKTRMLHRWSKNRAKGDLKITAAAG
ncbi:acyltransferase [Mycobacterium paragordonae]|uniref:Acyltransferase n=1 Tax=Mycobacterium paragordonae TaxID=1389713 RepID=A0ABQ1C3E9_9MYCO|nr:acyltransferase [Mycobacterium paragordonae]AYE95584.1 acyltransferase [Mycobacterium paragordonae]GFG78832.1 acyltransferase [Mycobacterium paragordonae]